MRLAIALSGGGLRATYFHLGVVRFLRDAGLMEDVTDVASVSGGSILAAHMLTNWSGYSDDEESFRQAADRLLEFGPRDIRGRILRRLPLCLLANFLPFYEQSRSRLLEQYYSRYLYDDARLASLAEEPRLHIMTTNLLTGESCSFSRNGFTVDSPRKEIKGSEMKLARAVACSSAFPGFFPPIPITADMLGTVKRRWNPERQDFTDGGVFDNLGLRKLKLIDDAAYEEVWFKDSTIASWVEICGRIDAKRADDASPESAIYRALSPQGRELIESVAKDQEADEEVPDLVAEFNELLGKPELYDDESWSRVDLQAELEPLLQRAPDTLLPEELAARNRGLFESAFPESFRVGDIPFDLVLLSDAGAPFDWETRHFEGLLSTALRAVNLLMHRIHGLERGHSFGGERCLELRIDDEELVDQDDPKLNASVRRRLPRTRTDLDRFRHEEIRALVMHGYCVARDRIRGRLEFKERVDPKVYEREPWDPFPEDPNDLSEASAGERFVSTRRCKIQPLTRVVYASFVGLFVALFWLGLASGWIDEALGLVFDRRSIHVERQVIYVQMRHFVDRESQPNGGIERKVGQSGSEVAETPRPVYDEAHYMKAYYLKPHRVEKMEVHSTSSGVCAVTPIIPERLQPDIHEYNRVDGARLDYDISLKTDDGQYLDYVLYSLAFYNGYQFNEKWQSDAGFHIDFPTDEFVMVFDFRGVDYADLVAGVPKLLLKRDGEATEITDPGAHFRGGVLHSPVLRDLRVGDEVQVNWKWRVEP